jgi:hypothetical protein
MAEVSATYPAGKYYIGDVCYALDDDVYHQQWGKKYHYDVGTHDIQFNGVHDAITMNYTAYGDGTYVDELSKLEFYVDSGTIGIVPFNLCSSKNIKDNKIKGGHFIESTTPIEFKSISGIFVIGYNDNQNLIIIDTDCQDDDDDD